MVLYQCMKIITVRFYRSANNHEPVRSWLLDLNSDDRKDIGLDIKTVEYGWPLGMPLVRKMDKDLWEVRVRLSGTQIARVLFTVHHSEMVLLHGFVKKSQKTPTSDLQLAKKRRDEVKK